MGLGVTQPNPLPILLLVLSVKRNFTWEKRDFSVNLLQFVCKSVIKMVMFGKSERQ